MKGMAKFTGDCGANPRLRFGNNLRRFRERDRLSQAALAKMVGTEQSTISNLEAGVRWPSSELAVKLAEALGVKVASLWRGV